MASKQLLWILVLIAVIVGVSFLFLKNHPEQSQSLITAATSPSQSANQYVGEISTNASGQNVYANNKFDFQFTYPQGWRVGDNILGLPQGGTFQLFNSDSPDTGKGFTKGENKIEVVIINTSDSSVMLSSSSPDYPTKSRESISLSLAGETATGVNVELIGGEQRRTYVVPLLSTPEKSLMISIYGDPSNFYVLDDLLKSIAWK